ncbi:MAG: hypothetical protein SCARUB_02278 [Candidatus Scalindua rubra]|uniref:Uncharacterized protein n=1 Tax=Candidatus Scalindua rubra TaxID=1872076 RepID=A0A1E3XC81_9BACT|nr:MAG: hypothetical protein SCARUB_02278 [Candidatus Scalindua rubra]
MKTIVLQITKASLDSFVKAVVPKLKAGDEIGLVLRDDDIIIHIDSTEKPRTENITSAALKSNIKVFPSEGFTLEDISILNNEVLTRLASSMISKGVRINALGFGTSGPLHTLLNVMRFPLLVRPLPEPIALDCESFYPIKNDDFGEATGTHHPGSGSYEEVFRSTLIEARTEALKKVELIFKEAENKYQCTKPCVRQFEILLGEPKERVVPFVEGSFWRAGVEIIHKIIVTVPWELNVLCRRAPIETGEIEDAPTSPEEEGAITCDGFSLGGIAIGRSRTPESTRKTRAQILEDAAKKIPEAMDKAMKEIRNELKKLPHCPGVNCPKERIKIVLGPIEKHVDMRERPPEGWFEFLLHFFGEAVVKIHWRIILECSS